jgi:hypothetical protein
VSLDVSTVAWYGGLLSIAVSAVLMGSLRINPRLFLRHFPPAVRASQPPLSSGERMIGRIVGLVLLGLFVGVPFWSARVAAQHDPAWPSVFLHAFLVGMAANLTDWLVLDELWLGVGRPRWALPPGVTLADVPFDHRQHFRGFLTGTALFAAIAALAATFARG